MLQKWRIFEPRETTKMPKKVCCFWSIHSHGNNCSGLWAPSAVFFSIIPNYFVKPFLDPPIVVSFSSVSPDRTIHSTA